MPRPAQMVCGRPCAEEASASRIERGEVVGLVGDNGAGKIDADQDPLRRARARWGRDLRSRASGSTSASPKDAMRLGIETIYQTNSMVPTMSIARNLFIGREPLSCVDLRHRRCMDQARMRARKREGDRRRRSASALARRAGRRIVGRSAPGRGDRTRDAFQVASVLVLDEPTNHLSVKETNKVIGFIVA